MLGIAAGHLCYSEACSLTQVINNYGPLGNAELLRRFGFVETDANPHACCQLSVAALLEAMETGVSNSGDDARCGESCSVLRHSCLRKHAAGIVLTYKHSSWTGRRPHW